MRSKLYYSPDEITTYLYTSGSEWMIESDFSEYFGFYHTYTNGDSYTLGTYDENLSKKLIPYEEMSADELTYSKLKPKQRVRYKTALVSYIPVPTLQEIQQGYITRYFVKKHNESTIIEINKTQLDQIKQKIYDPNAYQTVSILWYITGNRESSRSNAVVNLSVQEKNYQQIQFAKNTISNIHLKLNNLLEFYTDTTYIIPPDIN